MQRIADTLVFSPSDLSGFLECEYLTRLEIEVANGRVLEKRRPPEADLLAEKGEAHERAHLARLAHGHTRVVHIADPGPGHDWSAAARETREAMAAGADLIYQGVLVSTPDGPDAPGWRGRADFLIRVDEPSALGAWSYEVWDTKLARHAKPKHVLQLAFYSEAVAAIQGREPGRMHVVLGTGDEEHFRCRDFMAYFRAVRGRFLRSVRAGLDVLPYPVSHCGLCGYGDHCDEHWEAADHLSLIAGIRRSQVERLQDAGVHTGAALASINGERTGMGDSVLERLRHQAALQTHFRVTGEHRYDLLPPTRENGFRLLPPPSGGDIFFDMEGFPFFEPSGGLEYLFGAVTPEGTFSAFRAASRAEEKVAFEAFVDFVWDRLRRWPDLHVYHYAHYEPTALKRLMSLHGTREDEVDELLRREVFVDLYQVVRRSMRISHDSYSIKNVRQFFMPGAGKGEVASGAESVIEFQRWIDTGDTRILEAIQRYNEEDCVSTLRLRNWLLERRAEAERQFEAEIPWTCAGRVGRSHAGAGTARPDGVRDPVTRVDEHANLKEQLRRRAGETAADAGPALLVHLLDYHRREAKPEWWAYFERRKKSLDQLLDDTEAIACLTPASDEPAVVRRSLVYTLEFPPQEFKLRVDATVEGPLGEGAAGTIDWIDASRGRIGLKRDKRRHDDPLPAAVIAGGPVDDKAQREAIVRVAEALVAGEDRYQAVLDLLSCRPPRIRGIGPGAPIQTLDLAVQTRLVADLDDSYLFLQGPPGSGKTYTGARLIVSLLRQGKRIGVTAPNHRAIHNFLDEVEKVAAEERVAFTGIKKRSVSDETAYDGRFVTSVDGNDECERSDARLIAGTAWLFAREGMEGKLDHLFIDEAGQMALADAVAVGTSSRNIVLLGDPRQLPHVTQNTHPPIPAGHPIPVRQSSGCSVLDYLLADRATVSPERGLFLGRSWRMHPEVCRFVSEHSYDGRLASAPGCERQTVSSDGLCGAGLRVIPVEHRHNGQQSPEEAKAIAREVQLLLASGTVTDRDGVARPLTASDILVVAPYNMQVRCLRDALPDDVEVGTVDKFQGREGAVVFFSMASSSGEDVPRGLEFLFNRNRFNVAVSRAKCLSVVVCSPRLMEARCRTVGQMELVNALCQFVESRAARR